MDEAAIFSAALEKQDPEERQAFLLAACGEDRKRMARMEGLLWAHEHPDTFLVDPAARIINGDLGDEHAATINQVGTEKPGTQIGPYKLLQQIGEGGMGVVYMAEQTEPVERRVALKIIKPGMDTQQVIARFEGERQALAMMDHPNIARVLDAGTTDSGRPYFVMELVKGVPLNQYCDEKHLTPRERLQLFIPVCQAVQHAHQKGIIHRDIKPSNVLVALYDDKPVPKVIDFGVAKATSQRLTEKTMFTHYGQIVGTIDYMSPEQAQLNQLDVDTRSDIYSLGVLLYELLTGETPFDRQRLRSAAFDELLRIIREEEPPRPSIRLSSSHTLPSIASNRHTEPKKLSMLVRGELDWIVMKAMEKDRTRRYETASGFAADVQRYLEDEPVVACPPSAAYRFRKFARRNKAVFATTSFVLAALLLGIVGTTWQAVRATHEHRTAEVARREEVAQRAKAEQQRDRALKAEQSAEEQAEKAQTAAERAETAAENERQQRAAAETQRRLAEQQELRARRNLYAAHMNLARDAWDDADVPRVLDLLERHVPAPGEPDWRSFEWYYLLGLCNRDELTIPCGHSSQRPAFSPDGKILAVGVGGSGIELWDIDRRERWKVFKDITVEGPLAFSADGKTLASAGGGEVKLWDVATCNRLRSFGQHRHHITDIALTPDGSKLISTDGGNLDTKGIPGVIRVWDVATGELLHEMTGHTKYINSIAMSPDGNRLAAVGLDELRFWNLLTGEPVEGLAVRGGNPGVVTWSSRGNSLATEYQGHIVIWNASTGQETRRFKAPGSYSLALSPDGSRVASAGADSIVRLWDVETGKQLRVFKGHSQWLFYVGFSPDGKRIVSVGRDCNVKLWRVDVDGSDCVLAGTQSRQENADRVSISPDGELLAGISQPGTVAVVDFYSGGRQTTMDVGATINAIVFSPDGQRVAVAHARGLQIWDVHSGEVLQKRSSDVAVLTIAFSPNGRLLAVGTESLEVQIWHADSLDTQTVLPWRYQCRPRKVAFTPDGKTLGVATMKADSAKNREIQLWDVAGWRMRASHEYSDDGNGERSTDLAFSPDGRTLAVSEGSFLRPRDGAATRLFDVATGRPLATLAGDDAYHAAVAFSRDGKTLATASSQGEITFWDLETHEERMTFTAEGRDITSSEWNRFIASLAFSPDGRTLVTSDENARVWLWRGARQEQVARHERAALDRRVTEYTASGRWQEAVDLLSHLLERGDDLNIRFERAGALAELGRWDEAVADFEHVAGSGNVGYRVWYELAVANLGKGDQQGYRETCAKMLAKFSETTDPPAAYLVAWTCALQPQPDLDWGQLIATAALPLAEGDASRPAVENLGAVLYRAGLFEDAREQLQKAAESIQQDLSQTPSEYGLYLLAMVHAQLGHSGQARQCFDQAEGKPQELTSSESTDGSGQTPYWFRRITLSVLRAEAEALLQTPASAIANTGKPGESPPQAMAMYSRAIEARTDVPLLWRFRARVHERLNQTVPAEADLAHADQLEKEMPLRRLNRLVGNARGGIQRQARMERAEYYLSVPKDYDAAIRDCYWILRNGSPEAFQLLLQAHAARGTLDQAADDWRREFGEVFKFYTIRAALHQQRGEYNEAIDDYGQVIKLRPDDAEAWRQRAKVYVQLKQWGEAIADYSEVIKLKPSDDTAWYEQAMAYHKLGVDDQAITCFRQAIELEPTKAWFYANLGEALRDQGRLEEAITCFRQALELDTKQAWVHIELGNALRAQGKLEEAIGCFRKWIELDPKNASAHAALGEALSAQEKLEEAIACFRQAIELDPKYTNPHTLLGGALQAQGKLEEAIDCYRQAIELGQKDGWVYCGLGGALQAQRKLEEAIACYRKAIEVEPKNAWAYRGLGNVLEAQGKLDEAITCYRQAIEVEPKNAAVAYHLLGDALRAQGKLDEAMACYRQALEAVVPLEPKREWDWNTLSVAAYRMGDWKASLHARQERLQLRPTTAEDCLFLAMIHWQLGDQLEARKWYDEAVSEMGQAKTTSTILSRLRQEAEQLLGITPAATPPEAGALQPEKPQPPSGANQ